MINETDMEAFQYYNTIEDLETVDPMEVIDLSIMDMVEEFRTTMGQEKDPELSAGLVQEEAYEWTKENDKKVNWGWINPPKYSPELELKELADLVYVIYGYANSMNWDLDEAVRRVHENNMERCVWPDGSVKRREDGKVLKNPEAPKVYLEDLV